MSTDTDLSGYVRKSVSHALRCTLFALFLALFALPAEAQVRQVTPDIRVATPVKFDISPAMRDVDPGAVPMIRRDKYEIPNKTLPVRFIQNRALGTDAVLQQEHGRLQEPNALLQNFDGLGNADNQGTVGFRLAPPDPNMDVGEDHILQMINLVWTVYNKDGTMAMDPLPNNALWTDFGGLCETFNRGDPITLYDDDAGRWMTSQFAFNDAASDVAQCVAVSVTSDPTGEWYRYEFPMDELNDYPKMGVGADAYYYTHNEFVDGFSFAGAVAGAFERDAMIAGEPDPQFVLFGPNSSRASLLPADIDGPLPVIGTPHTFAELLQDQVRLYEMEVDWNDVANTTFNEVATLDVAPFNLLCPGTSRQACIEQPNGQNLASLGDRLMHRLQFRDMGGYDVMVASHTVDATGNDLAGIRWYEFRNEGSGWEVYQQGTYAPDDGLHRWMPSIAMNSAGVIAVGYSASSSTENPSVRYTARPPGAPLGEMTIEEEIIFQGPSAQAGINRWGDYSAMVVDPTNGSFWYQNEYASDDATDYNWDTRIASFAFDVDDDVPPGAIADLAADALGSSVALTWTAPADDAGDSGSGPVAFYDARYSTDGPIDADNFDDATPLGGEPSPAEPGTEQSFIVSDLDFETEYWFAIQAVDDAFNTSLSNSPSTTTGAQPVLAYTPEALSATLEPNQTTDEVLTISNEGAPESTLEFWFPGFAAMHLLERPGIETNDVSRPLANARHAKGDDPYAGAGHPVILGAGGPDGFGYTWIDSNEPGGPAFDWVDISDVGTELSVNDDFGANPAAEVDLPFAFEFYGEEKTVAWVDNNGFLFFDSPVGNYFSNDPIPTAGDPNGIVAPFWDDLDPDAGGAIYAYHDSDNHRFIVQYDEVPSFSTGELYTFQIILYANGSIRFQYLDMDESNIDSATTGIENADGSDGLQIAFNTAYVEDGLAVEIAVVPTFIANVEPASGFLDGGQSQDVTVTLDSEAIEPGTYENDLALASNDPEAPSVVIPATLNVESGPPHIALDPTSLDFGEVFEGGAAALSFTIENVGGGPLEVESISSDNDAFAVSDEGPFTVPFAGSRTIDVTFSPDEVSTFAGVITVASDDPDDPTVTLDVEGEGVPAPVIVTSPDELSQTLEVGEMATDVLTVGNEGGSDLVFEAVFQLAPGENLTREMVAASFSGRSSAPASEAVASARPAGTAPSSPEPLDAMDAVYQLDDGTSENALGLGGLGDVYDMMWLNAFEVVEGAGTITSISTTWGADGSTSTPPEGMTGLALVYNDPNNDGDPTDAELLSQTEITVADPGTNNFTTVATEPTAVDGIFFIAVLLEDNDPNTFVAPMDESSPYQGASWFAGTATGEDFDIEDLAANSVPPTEVGSVGFPANWLLRADGGASFVTISPTAGTVAPGSEADLTVAYDATGMEPGLYEGDVLVTSNDPATPADLTPTTLEVVYGTPEIAVEPASIDYGEVFEGDTAIETVTIYNEGNAPLEVTNVSSDNDAFTANFDGPITIPLEDSAQVSVTFAPDAVQSYSGTLAIESNDPDEGTVTVALAGEGIPAPVIAVDPEELSDEVQIGQTTTSTLTINNTGGSTLDFVIGFSERNPNAPDRSEIAAPTSASGFGASSERGGAFASANPSGGNAPSTPIPFDAEDADYQVDDGTSEDALGLTNGGDIMWMNAFEAIDGSASIGTLYTAYGFADGTGLPDNRPATAYVYEDPNDDGNPSDAVKVAEVDFELQNPHTDLFTAVDMGGAQVDGVFFIAVLYQSQAIGEFPSPMDVNSGSMQSSWVVGHTVAGGFDDENLAANSIPPELIDNIGFPGNWLLRADGGEGGGGNFPDWIAIEPFEGSVAPGGSQELTVTYDASELEVGTYGGDVQVASNDPVTPIVEVPTTLEVEAAPYPFALTPDALTVTLDLTAGDTTATETFNIENVTDAEQFFSIEVRGASGNAPVFQNFFSEALRAEYEQRMAMMAQRPSRPSEPSMERAPDSPRESATQPFAHLMAPIGVSGFGTNLFQDEFVSFDLGEPENLMPFGTSPLAYAGDYVSGDDETFYIVDDANAFMAVDKETGETTPIGTATPNSGELWSELAGDPTSGTLYGSAASDVGTTLYTIDPATGEATEVAPITNNGAPVPFVIAIAIDASGQMWGYEISNDTFLKIDKATGEATTVGPIGFDANFAQGMDYDMETGTMYMAAYNVDMPFGERGQLRTVDLETGNTTLIGQIGPGDELGYLALPSGGFLTINTDLLSGTLAPFGDITIDANFDATGIFAGTYEAELVVISDVPGRPEEHIPVTVTVIDAPEATIEPDEVDFGEVFAGGDTTQTLTLANTGGEVLNVSGIEVTPEVFSIADSIETSFTLEPGQARAYTVRFSPEAAQAYTGSFTVVSNDPRGDVSATLTGTGIPAPAIAVNPESFDLKVFAGQTDERTLEIANEGEHPLSYAINGEFVGFEGPKRNVTFEDVILEQDFNNGIPDNWSVVDAIEESATWDVNTTWDDDNWTGGDGLAAASSSFPGFPDPYDTRLVTPEMTASVPEFTLEFKANYQAFGTDSLDVDITTDGGATWTTMANYNEDNELGALFGEGATVTLNLAPYLETGDQFQIRWRYYNTDGAADWYAQVDDVVISRELEFLTIEPAADTVAVGASQNVTLGIDAVGLPLGTYEVNLNVASNDPVQPTTTVPFALEVVESLTVTPGEEDSTVVHPNEEFLLPVVVSENLNGLGVRSYEFTLTFAAPLLDALGVETEGTLSEDVQVTANTDEDGQIQVAAAESGGDAPLFDLEGQGTLIYVRFRANEALGATDLAFTQFRFNEGEPPASTETGRVVVDPLYGDVTLNLEVSAFDAAQALQYAVGALELNETAIVSGDVTGNGELSAFDAAYILDYAVGKIDCFPAVEDCEGGDAPIAAAKQKGTAAPSAAFGWGEAKAAADRNASKSAAEGSGSKAIDLPLTVRGASGPVRALQITSQVDPQKVAIDDVVANVPDDWQLIHHVAEDGTVRIALAGASPLSGDRNVATLKLRWLQEDAQLELAGEAIVNEAQPQQIEAASLTPIPEKFALKGNYPNPFGQVTQIAIDLPGRANVRVEVYDVLGRRVMVAQDGEMQAGTNRTVQIDGSRLASGLYLYRVVADIDGERQVDTGRMTLVR